MFAVLGYDDHKLPHIVDANIEHWAIALEIAKRETIKKRPPNEKGYAEYRVVSNYGMPVEDEQFLVTLGSNGSAEVEPL